MKLITTQNAGKAAPTGLTAAETTILANFRRMAPVDAEFILKTCVTIGARSVGNSPLRLVTGGAR